MLAPNNEYDSPSRRKGTFFRCDRWNTHGSLPMQCWVQHEEVTLTRSCHLDMHENASMTGLHKRGARLLLISLETKTLVEVYQQLLFHVMSALLDIYLVCASYSFIRLNWLKKAGEISHVFCNHAIKEPMHLILPANLFAYIFQPLVGGTQHTKAATKTLVLQTLAHAVCVNNGVDGALL